VANRAQGGNSQMKSTGNTTGTGSRPAQIETFDEAAVSQLYDDVFEVLTYVNASGALKNCSDLAEKAQVLEDMTSSFFNVCLSLKGSSFESLSQSFSFWHDVMLWSFFIEMKHRNTLFDSIDRLHVENRFRDNGAKTMTVWPAKPTQ
jgi:hypothetical protein